MDKTTEQIENGLIAKIGRAKTIIDEVSNGKGWKYLLEDFGETKKRIDDNWHLVSDVNKLAELRVTKMAINSVLNTIDTYTHDLKLAQEQLEDLRNPDKTISKDFDTEGI